MAIKEKSIKILWAAAAGRCAFPGCWERLCFHEAHETAPYTLGQMAHICGDKPGANRHDASQSADERDDYQNLILLCPTHHSLIDRKENEAVYTVSTLHQMKAEHEKRVLERVERDDSATKDIVARLILPLLEENRQSWRHYGPESELALKEPHNEEAHAVWESEKVSVIVPNNRRISELLRKYDRLFDAQQQEAIGAFLLHARSYESWVSDEIPYAAVKRFPNSFDELIRGIANGGS